MNDVLCKHCVRTIIPAPDVGLGWRHAHGMFVSCHPGQTGTTLAEPEASDVED